MIITLDIVDNAAAAFIAGRIKGDNSMTDEDFIATCLRAAVIEEANNYLLANAQRQAVASVTLIEDVTGNAQ